MQCDDLKSVARVPAQTPAETNLVLSPIPDAMSWTPWPEVLQEFKLYAALMLPWYIAFSPHLPCYPRRGPESRADCIDDVVLCALE